MFDFDFGPIADLLAKHTTALNTHSATMEKFMAVAANGASSGEAPAARGRGRPTNAEKAAAGAATVANLNADAPAAATVAQTLTTSVAATAVNAAAANAQTGPLTHQSLAPKVVLFAKAKGRDALVALLGEFGAADFAKVPADQLGLFQDRLDGKPQTPTVASDLGNLLGL